MVVKGRTHKILMGIWVFLDKYVSKKPSIIAAAYPDRGACNDPLGLAFHH